MLASRSLALLPRACLLSIPLKCHIPARCMAKKVKASKSEDVDRIAGQPAEKPVVREERGSRLEGSAVTKKKFDGCIVKYHRDPQDMVPPFEELLREYPSVYSNTHILRAATQEDIGKFINIEAEAKLLPSVLSATLDDPFLMTGAYLLLRQTMFDLIAVLQEIDSKDKNAKGSAIGVHGQRGGGKTVLLNMLAVYALQNPQEWLLLSTRGEEFMTDLHGGLKPSSSREGIFNQGRNSRAYLKNMMSTQAAKLKKIQLKREYNYPWLNVELLNSGATIVGQQAREGAKPPTNLYGLCEQAVYDLEMAADIFYDFVEEIRLATECKTLVLIDNVNVWDQMSEFRDPANPYKKIAARKLSMVDAFQKFQTSGPSNGLSVFALTSHATLNFGKTHLEGAAFTLDQKVYSNAELKTAYTHYKASKMLKSDLNPFLMARVKGLTGCVPRDAFFDAALI